MMARPTALDGYHVVMCITNKHQLKGHAACWNAGAQVPQTHWNVLGLMYSERGLAIMHNRSSRMAFSRSILAYSTAGSSPEVPSVVVEVQTGCSAGFAAPDSVHGCKAEALPVVCTKTTTSLHGC